MADNTGNYTSEAKLLLELVNAGKGTKTKVALSAKAANGDNFDFDITGVTPKIGDYIVKGDLMGRVVGVATGKVTVDKELPTGVNTHIETDLEPEELTAWIKESMEFIDRHTRQWFNRREYVGAKAVLIEGNNSPVLFFPVPIIEVYNVKKYKDAEVVNPDNYQVFNGRELPDDRRCPMIKLRRDDDDVLFMGTTFFMRGVRSVIEGAFGFLEPDGSTPALIQRATLKLALMRAMKSLGEVAKAAAENQGLGAIKREKTDLHEIEYFDPNATGNRALSNGTGLSGDDEIDDIIAAYRGPILIDGTSPDFGVEAPYLSSLKHTEGGYGGGNG